MYFQKKLSKLNTKTYCSDLGSIPWDEAARIYKEAADLQEANTLAALKDKYDRNYSRERERLEAEFSTSEASYEGDVDLSYNVPTLDSIQLRSIRAKAGNAALEEQFIKAYQLKSWGIALLDQIVAEFSKHKLNDTNGLINGMQYLKDNLDPKSERDIGIYRFLMMDGRSSYLDKMGSGPSKKYCTLVPLILYAHKLYHNVDYSRWDRETLHFVVNNNLCEAMLTEVPEISNERLLELRDIGLIRAGVKRNPATTYSLYRLADTELKDCGSLLKIMLLQTWAAHPSNRTKYMVLDPMNWDRMPTPLINTNIITQPAVQITRVTSPWDA